MIQDYKTIYAKHSDQIHCIGITGHFATTNFHTNCYVDLTEVRFQHKMAELAGKFLADTYRGTVLDTILCLESTEVIGAAMVGHLSGSQPNIHVLSPELNKNNQMVFCENIRRLVAGKRILLLISTASYRKNILHAFEKLQQEQANIAGICALFSTIRELNGIAISSLFDETDFPGYSVYKSGKCPMCEQRHKIDAIINSYGLTHLH